MGKTKKQSGRRRGSKRAGGGEKSYTPFPPIVCGRIRNLNALIEGKLSRKRELVSARDKADDVLAQIERESENGSPVREPRKALQAQADFGMAVREIEHCNEIVKGARRDLSYTIEHADEPGLFASAEVSDEDFLGGDEEEGEDEEDDLYAAWLDALKLPGPIEAKVRKAGVESLEALVAGLETGQDADWGLTKEQRDAVKARLP